VPSSGSLAAPTGTTASPSCHGPSTGPSQGSSAE
jgi:hypothetical protein